MNKPKILSLTASMLLAVTFIFSCSSDDSNGGGGGVSSSSVSDGGSSSSEGTQGMVSSSSDGGEENSQSYSYCVISENEICLGGPFTLKDCNSIGGRPSNNCPYGGVEPSSSSVETASSSSEAEISSDSRSSSSVGDGNQSSSSNDVEKSSSSEETVQSSSSEEAVQSSSSQSSSSEGIAKSSSSQSSSSEETAQSSSSVKKETCGTQEFDTSVYRCSNGNLQVNCSYLQQHNQLPSNFKCEGEYMLHQCGTTDKYYNLETEFCLSNEVFLKCSGNGYNPAAQSCINGIVLTKCGIDYYDPEIKFCSDNTVYSKCGGNTYRPTNNEICRNDVILKKCGVTDEYYNDETEFCQTNLIYPKCNGLTYDLSKKCENDVLLTKCGTTDKYYNSATEFCLDGDIHSLCNGSPYNPTAAKCNQNGFAVRNLCSGVEYDPYSKYCVNGTVEYKGTFTDERDGNTYTYVKINSQTWMAENLKYNAVGSVCYDNLTSNCEKYGKLYNWATAMAIDIIYNGDSYTAQAKHQGICPSGWHIPSNADWDILLRYVDGKSGTSSPYNSSTAGIYLKTTSGWSVGGNGTDQYGFSALPGGRGYSYGSFIQVGGYGYWWSASEYYSSQPDAYTWTMYYYANIDFASGNHYTKSYLNSVRCLQD